MWKWIDDSNPDWENNLYVSRPRELVRLHLSWKSGIRKSQLWPCNFCNKIGMSMGVSENVVYPFLPNGFADHYPVFKWLFHWEYTRHFQTNPYDDHDVFFWPARIQWGGFHMIPAYVHRHLSSPTSCNSAVIEVKSYPGECPFKGLLTKTYGCGSFHPSLNLNNRDV